MRRFAACGIVAVLAAALALSCGDPFSSKVSHVALDDAGAAIDDAEIADAMVPPDISIIDAPDAFVPADVAIVDAPDAFVPADAPVIDAPAIDAPAIDAPPDAAMIDAPMIDAPPGMTTDAPAGMTADARPDAPGNNPIIEDPNLVQTSFYACAGSPATPLSAIPLVAAITFAIRRRRRINAQSS